MLSSEGSLGDRMLAKIKIGDLVSWKLLGEDEVRDLGLIIDFYQKRKGGRNIIYAKVVRFRGSAMVSVPVVNLKRFEGPKNEV